MYRVVFLGSNPSQVSSLSIAFGSDTMSSEVLAGWLDQIENQNIASYCFLNVSNTSTPNNRALKVSEIKQNLDRLKQDLDVVQPDKIIALGKTAEKALTLLRLDFYSMPHPSGRNRKLNDKQYVAKKINGLRDYLSPSKIELLAIN